MGVKHKKCSSPQLNLFSVEIYPQLEYIGLLFSTVCPALINIFRTNPKRSSEAKQLSMAQSPSPVTEGDLKQI
jgi:hypothetical protein